MPEAAVLAEPASCWTEREIAQQPETLLATHALLATRGDEISGFLGPLLARPDLRIVLTGAGSSAFIGDCLAPSLARRLERRIDAVATTDIVSAPDLYLAEDAPTLLVSFGRSGDSPESRAAVQIANRRLGSVHHLVVTCNAEGALAHEPGPRRLVLLLPPETHDRGFAMTSSFTAMTYAAMAAFEGLDTLAPRVRAISAAMAAVAPQAHAFAEARVARRLERVVYLGAGPFKGLAREAALKLLELTDGQVAAIADTPLGFRHGPKTFVTPRTAVIVFVSNNPTTRAYDLDLVDELRRDGEAAEVLTLAADASLHPTVALQDLGAADDLDLVFPYIAPAQTFALQASLALGITPDQPSRTGAVNRVVQGVRIHPAA